MLSVLHTAKQGINNSLTRNSLVLSTMELKIPESLGSSLAPSALVPTHSAQKYPSLLLIPFCIYAMPGFGAVPPPGPEEHAAGCLSRPGHQLSLRLGLPIRLSSSISFPRPAASPAPLGSPVLLFIHSPMHHGELSLPQVSSSWSCPCVWGQGHRYLCPRAGRADSEHCPRSPSYPSAAINPPPR